MESDEAFCRRRAIEEQVAANKATCAVARERHEELADMYRLRVEALAPAAANGVGDAINQSTRIIMDDVDLVAD